MTLPAIPNCLHCGAPLQWTALAPDVTPWVCLICHHGYWHSEVTAESRQAYNPAIKYWEPDYQPVLHQAIDQERTHAVMRGSSLRPDQIGLVPPNFTLAQGSPATASESWNQMVSWHNNRFSKAQGSPATASESWNQLTQGKQG